MVLNLGNRVGLNWEILHAVSISQLCRWFDVPRRTVYYKPTKKPPTVQERFAAPIKQMIEEHPSFGYRTVAYLLKVQQELRIPPDVGL